MSAQIFPPYPPTLTTHEKEYLLSNLKDWSIAHGLAVRPAETFVSKEVDPAGALATTAPVTLFPSLFPRRCFEQAKAVSKAYNELYSAIAVDELWLGDICKELLDIDDFIGNLWNIHVKVKSEGYVQPIQLDLFRSDYMVHVDNAEGSQTRIKQVEFNTIASSFGGLSSHVSGLHRTLQSIDAYPDALQPIINNDSLPEATSIPKLALGLAKAHLAYTNTASPSRSTCVLFIVQDPERNVFDQRHLEYELNGTHSVRTFRISFDRVLADTHLEVSSRKLLYTPPHTPHKSYEVTTLYFRAGYAPSDYTSEEHWAARLHLERSAAIKCPSILTHLAGSKKVQQVLATPESPHLARFLPDQTSSSAVLDTFAPIYPLDKSAAGMTARSLATNPETAIKYVLKPQREGGGNNVYRSDIPGFLESLPETHWPAYILMEMIEPPAQANSIFRNGEIQSGDVICELGVYGACLWKDGKDGGPREILENFDAGYLLRTKGAGSAEGGVAAGFGSVDSCCLIDV